MTNYQRYPELSIYFNYIDKGDNIEKVISRLKDTYKINFNKRFHNF